MPRLRRLLTGHQDTDAETLAGPLRGELLGSEHLAERIRAMAVAQRLRPPAERRRGAPLLRRLEETRHILEDAHRRLSDRGPGAAHIGPAGE